MKVFHIESGLGNQMLDYADMLASKSVNPMETYYIENIIYELGDEQDKISMWNGYELHKIFNISEKNVKELFSEGQWKSIVQDVMESRFWETGWSYSEAICSAFSKHGMCLVDQNPHLKRAINQYDQKISFGNYALKQVYYKLIKNAAYTRAAIPQRIFKVSSTDDYDGHYLKLMYKGNQISNIEKTLRETFVFPEYDPVNAAFAKKLKKTNSVAIHARRGDFLGLNAHCYKYGYFKRAVKYIKKHVDNPYFVFFCDSGSIEWVKQNATIFGLDYKIDDVCFVDWNVGENSFRDMQLMADCKHNVITNSSFGWWGAFLNDNPNKITCSPDARILTTHWF